MLQYCKHCATNERIKHILEAKLCYLTKKKRLIAKLYMGIYRIQLMPKCRKNAKHHHNS